MHEIYECEFKKLDLSSISYLHDDHPLISDNVLQPRQAFYGGRTGHAMQYYKAPPGTRIMYADVCSLYPAVNKFGEYMIGHPKIYIGDECFDVIGQNYDISQIHGVIKCAILPPRSLLFPVLPLKINNRLLFPLCRTCAENSIQIDCPHNNPGDRELVGSWMSVELIEAQKQNYEIKKIYEIWDYETTQYNPETREGGLFAEYINNLFVKKVEASGFPDWCVTEEDKQNFVRDVEEAEGVTLDISKIKKNPALRTINKLGNKL